ncbi:MAG: monofunctional biosynthetic peptidoglycan transglycosylase [Gemmatimonadota bacterium]|nr:monofunctional biosynthetic peptidoglycan transglycosylase [Gemmatimonadota bacterium]
MTRRARLLLGLAAGLLVGAAGAALYQRVTWPDVAALAETRPSTTAFIDAYRGRRQAAGTPADVAWHWVPWSAISVHLKRAAVAAEDMEFFFHRGFSSAEIGTAIREAVEERRAPRGASTITQQLAKNLWLSPSRNPWRKVKEALLTRSLERHLSKQRILALYLNVVEFGPGIYGAEAAAWHYFGKPASALGEREAAMLAASLPRPSTWHPGVASTAYASYVETVAARMARADYLWKYVGGAPIAMDTLPPALDSVAPPSPDSALGLRPEAARVADTAPGSQH